jgi:hypothetical protein
MARGNAAGNAIEIRPANNIYTALVIAAFVAELVAFLAMFLRARELNIPLF